MRESLQQKFTRGDYRELVELSLMIITNGSEPENFVMKHPGALHRARWMAKLLYSIKIVLLSNNITKKFSKAEVATKTQINKLERFCVFAVSVYVPWWLVCPVATNAPINDLILANNLDKYKSHDPVIANKGLKALSRHTWYLHEELVPLVLFSPMIEEEEKESMRHRLLQFESAEVTERIGLLHGKPDLKPVPPPNTKIIDLIGPASIRFFSILNVSHSFLHTPASKWTCDKSFQAMKQIVDNLQVVNEAAERGVKLCHDFIGVTKDENRFQKILQVVETVRKHVPNQRRLSGLSEGKSWFLSINRD